MSEHEILNDIRTTFDGCVSVTPEKMLSLLDDDVSEKAAVIEHRKFRYTSYLKAACAVLVMALSAGVLCFAGIRDENNDLLVTDSEITEVTDEYNSVVMPVQTTVTAGSDREAVSSVSETTVTRPSETSVQSEKPETVTSVPVSETTEVPEFSEVTEENAEESEHYVTVSEVSAETVPVTGFLQHEVTAPLTEYSSEPAVSVTAESRVENTTEDDFPEVRVFLEKNPLWTGSEREEFRDFTGRDYIYTVKDPDQYIVKFYFGENTESLTVEAAVAMHFVTVDSLIESGMEYVRKTSVR